MHIPDMRTPASQFTLPDGLVDASMVAENDLPGRPPSLPPIPIISHKTSFTNMFSVDTSTNIDGIRRKPLASSPLNPRVTIREAHDPEFPMLAEQRPRQGHSENSAEAFHEPPNTLTSLRYTSSGSSTLRSRQSGSTSPQSRPSSRSSVEEHLTMLDEHPGGSHKVLRQDRFLRYGVDDTQKVNSGFQNLSTTGSHSTLSGSPTNLVHRNKPLPPQPGNESTSPKRLTIRKSALGSIRIASPEPHKSTRGERLGQQMVGRISSAPRIPASIISPTRPLHDNTKTDSARANDEARMEMHDPLASSSSQGSNKGNFPSSTPERVFLKVLSRLDSLEDLQCASMVNKGLQRTFIRYEQDLVSRILFRSSLPAWELRQIMKCEQKRRAFRLKSVLRDAATIRALQSFILMKCKLICRSTTIEALLGRNQDRKLALDNALWRIWIFCRLFGRKREQENTFNTQLLWLDGGERRAKMEKTISLGIGNGSGLTISELEDMSEMWSCLEALLGGFRNREDEALRVGIFDHCMIENDEHNTRKTLLNAWMYDILTLGPKAVLTLTSCSFEQAKVLGITNWTPPKPGQTRVNFLRGAIEHIYRERLVSDARSKALEFEKMMRSQPRENNALPRLLIKPPVNNIGEEALSDGSASRKSTALESSAQIRISRNIIPDCDLLKTTQPDMRRQSQAPSTPVFSSFAITSGASVRLGATLFPLNYPKNQPVARSTEPDRTMQPSTDVNLQPGQTWMIDPVDVAIHHLVKDRKFPEADAKRALAISDDGRGIDVPRAIGLLTNRPIVPKARPKISELHGSPVASMTELEPDSPPLFKHQNARPQRNPSKNSKLLKRAKNRSNPPLSVIFDAENEDGTEVIGPANGNMHQSLEASAELSHSVSVGPGPPNRASFSQKFPSGRFTMTRGETSRSLSLQHDTFRTKPRGSHGRNFSYQAYTAPVPATGASGLFPAGVIERHSRPDGRLLQDRNRRNTMGANSGVGYAY